MLHHRIRNPLNVLMFIFDVVDWPSNAAQTLGVTGCDPALACSDIVTSRMEDQTGGVAR